MTMKIEGKYGTWDMNGVYSVHPAPTKHEGWGVVSGVTGEHTHHAICVFDSREEAKQVFEGSPAYDHIVPVTWED